MKLNTTNAATCASTGIPGTSSTPTNTAAAAKPSQSMNAPGAIVSAANSSSATAAQVNTSQRMAAQLPWRGMAGGCTARPACCPNVSFASRSEEHTSELQSLMRISYAVYCLKKITNQHIESKTTNNMNKRT